jgi:glutamate racemase
MNESLPSNPRVLVFDSGLGGLTVFAEVAKARADAELTYVADDAAFPYGALEEQALTARVVAVMDDLIAHHAPDIVVIACSTASTLVLAPLRARHPALAFVGTVPAIKPAAAASRSRLVSVLATPGTVARDYTHALVRKHAGDCEVALVGSPVLAGVAEDWMKGLAVDEAEIARAIAPCFVERDGRRTDHIVLACTHYPLLRAHFERCRSGPGDRPPRRRAARAGRRDRRGARAGRGVFHQRESAAGAAA